MNILGNHKAALTFVPAIILFLYLIPSAVAQNKVVNVPTTPNNCEDALAILDMTLIEGQKDKESNFILIARLGNGERTQRLNQRRLRAVMSYFRNKGESKVVTASGERVTGLGRIELYVGGKLLEVLAYPKNGFIDCRGL